MINCQMIKVSSSNVSEVGYNDNNSTLYVRFNNNTLYQYFGVPKIEYEGLLYAPSVGSYLYRNIKGIYTYERLE